MNTKNKPLVLSQPTLLALKGIQAVLDRMPVAHAVLYDCTLEVEVLCQRTKGGGLISKSELFPNDTEMEHGFSFRGHFRFAGSENSNKIEGSISVRRPNSDDVDDDNGGFSWRLDGCSGKIKFLEKLYTFDLHEAYFTAPLSVAVHSCADAN